MPDPIKPQSTFDMEVARPISKTDEYRAEQYAESTTPGFSEGWDASNQLNTVLGVLGNQLGSSDKPIDPDFKITEELRDQWFKELPQEYHDRLMGAMSEEHGWNIIGQVKNELTARDTLNRMGWGGVGVELLNSMTDPVAWGAMIASEGAAAPWIFANKASKVAKAVKGAVVAGGSNAALETYLYSQSQTKDPLDILWAGMVGATLGGAITPFIGPGGRAGSEAVQDIVREETRRATDAAIEGEAEALSSVHVNESGETVEAPVAPTEEQQAFEQYKEKRKEYLDAQSEYETHNQTMNEAIDSLAVLNDTVRVKDAGVSWLTQEAKNVTEDGKFSITENYDDLPLRVQEQLDPDEFEELKAELTEMGGMSPDEMRKELRARAKASREEMVRQQWELDKLNTRTETLRQRAARLKAEEEEANEFIVGGNHSDSAGAARVEDSGIDIDEYNLEDALDSLDNVAQDTTAIGKLRFDIIGRLMRSENEFVRHMAGRLAEDAVGRGDNSAAGVTASEMATFIRVKAQANVYRVMNRKLDEWLMDVKGGNWKDRFRPSLRREFNEEVSRYIRGGYDDAPDAVREVGEAMQKEYMDFLAEAKKAGLKGFDNIDPNPNYLPRFLDHVKIRQMTAEFYDTDIHKLIQGAIKKAIPDIDDLKADLKGLKYSERLARGYLKKIRGLHNGVDNDFTRVFSAENTELLKEILEEGGVPKADIETVLADITRKNKNKDAGKSSRAKQRLDLDENYSIEVKDRNGRLRTLKMADLFNNDAEQIFSTYSRQMSGQIALGRMGWKSKGDFGSWLNMVKKRGAEQGKDTNKEVELLEFLYKAIVGSPLEKDPASFGAQAGRFMRDWNFIRIMNQVGFAQVAEIGNIVGQLGWKATLQHIPELRRTMKRLKDGDIDDDFANQIEAIWGIGTERMRNQVHTRFDEYGADVGTAGSILNKVDTGMQYAKRITGDISLMAPINMMLHRTAVKGVIQKMTDTAAGLEKINPKRLATLGIDEEMAPRIWKLLRKHTNKVDSQFGKGRKVNRLDMKAMMEADPEAADIFVYAVNRWTKRIIQENDIGATHEWMHSTLGKILTQFRSFMLTAWGKQTLHNVKMADMQTFASFAWSMVFGGLAYSTQTAINSVGRGDQSEYLEERLSPTHLGLSAFQRAGAASLIPAAMDTVWTTGFSDDPIFAYGRSTGLASNLLLGNPTVDTINKMTGVLGLTKNLRSDYEFSQKNVRDIWGLMWFSNAMVMRNLSELMLNDLPHRSNSN